MPADRTTSDPTPDPQPRLTRLKFKKTSVSTPRTLTQREVIFQSLPTAIRARHRDHSSFWRDTDTGPRTHTSPPSLAFLQTKRRPHHLPAPTFIKGHTISSTQPTTPSSSTLTPTTNSGTSLHLTEAISTSPKKTTKGPKGV